MLGLVEWFVSTPPAPPLVSTLFCLLALLAQLFCVRTAPPPPPAPPVVSLSSDLPFVILRGRAPRHLSSSSPPVPPRALAGSFSAEGETGETAEVFLAGRDLFSISVREERGDSDNFLPTPCLEPAGRLASSATVCLLSWSESPTTSSTTALTQARSVSSSAFSRSRLSWLLRLSTLASACTVQTLVRGREEETERERESGHHTGQGCIF